MTITTPPREARTPRRPRPDDAPAPARRTRRRTPARAEVGDERATAAMGTATRTATGTATKGTARDDMTRSGGTKDGGVKNGRAGNGGARNRAVTTTDRPVRQGAAADAAPARRPARSPRRAAPPRTPFVLLVVGLLSGALVSLLLLNTVLAQDAFTLSELQRGNQRLSERKQALQEDISREGSPAVLHAKARALGMVDAQRPAFVDERTGRVTEGGARPPGVPDEAVAAAAASGVTGAPGAIAPPAGAVPQRPGGTAGGTR